jgi:NAD(P) transhydrogenase subunit alpha
MTSVWIPKESGAGESRVAATPETVKKMVAAGLDVRVEAGAGETSFLTDKAYEKAGAELVTDGKASWAEADVILKVGPPTEGEARTMKSEAVLVALMEPDRNIEAVKALSGGRVSTLAMELIPRITRAQSMDALSSQANIGGYKAVLIAASRLSRYFPLLMTAAGTIPPARVVIVGAGVAGLQAIATAKRLGAIVEVSDIREAVKEQVQSLGGRFIELPMQESGEGEGGYAKEMTDDFLAKQRQILKEHISAADVVITTAAIPGRPAPRLVGADMVEAMRPGSVIVDLAAERGGNCELTRPGEEVVHNGVLILGPLNVAATVSHDASMVYARNVLDLLLHMVEDGKIAVDPDDEILSATLLTHAGEIVHNPTAESIQGVAS